MSIAAFCLLVKHENHASFTSWAKKKKKTHGLQLSFIALCISNQLGLFTTINHKSIRESERKSHSMYAVLLSENILRRLQFRAMKLNNRRILPQSQISFLKNYDICCICIYFHKERIPNQGSTGFYLF